MGAPTFAGPFPEWPAEDKGKQLISVHVGWDVDKLSRALFGSSSAFGVRISRRHDPGYPDPAVLDMPSEARSASPFLPPAPTHGRLADRILFHGGALEPRRPR